MASGLRALGGALGMALALACSAGDGVLEIRVVDAAGRPVPARVELLDAEGGSHLADDALEIKVECWTPPFPEWASRLQRSRGIDSPYTGTTWFYLDGAGRATLAAGRYRITASRGTEHRPTRLEVEVAAGQTRRIELAPERWIDLASEGWYSADDHLHITRLTPEDQERIGTWMRAEDLHVANLLRMGTVEQFDITPQLAFGDAGAHRDGATLLLAGQESPRTHVLGHTITLGAEAAIDRRDAYLDYRGFWEESRRLGGASGYAHWGTGHANDGLAIDGPSGLLSFVEVLQFDFPYFDVWYELLDLGVRLAPTAGTDFPCLPSVPGRDRFYTRVDGLPTRASFVEGLRLGRTFATNGPVLDFEVDGSGVGATVEAPRLREVRVRGRVRFDPGRDDVQRLELVEAGAVVAVATEAAAPGEIRIDLLRRIAGPTWLALRASGEKVGETRLVTPWYMEKENLEVACRIGCGASVFERADYVGAGRARPAVAHSAPVYVSGPDGPRPSEALVRSYLARLDDLEARLSDERLEELVVWRPLSSVLLTDGVPESAIRRDRPLMRERIGAARAYYRALLRAEAGESGRVQR